MKSARSPPRLRSLPSAAPHPISPVVAARAPRVKPPMCWTRLQPALSLAPRNGEPVQPSPPPRRVSGGCQVSGSGVSVASFQKRREPEGQRGGVCEAGSGVSSLLCFRPFTDDPSLAGPGAERRGARPRAQVALSAGAGSAALLRGPGQRGRLPGLAAAASGSLGAA